VAVTPDVGSIGVIREALWSEKAQADRQKLCPNWILDDRKLAWCTKKIGNPITTKVDLDAERGRKARRAGSSDFYVTIRYAKTLRLEVLPAYLREKMGFDNSVIEAMNFLDHLIRQGPADTHRVIRRLFFAENQQPRQLDANIDVFKGFYGSIRLCQSIFEGSSGLGINVDVSNTAFWRPKTVDQMMLHYLAAFDRKYANCRSIA
jgi:eukaryotic translation initiation factor 2C